ncbi:urease accessory protein UreF [Natronoglomus mannanivorans]|uniref:Urease accessory protein UreF n=1 Tax=Natronoglomus mannanivorans TaxID=2979990 RepID=A0AAP3E2J7_9EURY|nr:urease accessory protein UreF [Halobacteria archaeon AArc-xg1-1]
MTTDTNFLAALRLSDSFLPVGSFTASYGIEQYVNEGVIEDAEDLQAVLSAYLERIVGPCDTIAVANAHAASERGDLEALLAVDERLHAVTMPREFRESSTKAGTQLCELLLSEDGISGVGAGFESGFRSEREFDAEPTTDDPESNPLEDHVHAYTDAIECGETAGHYAVVFGVLAQQKGLEREQACQAQAYSFVVGLLGAAQRLGRFGHTEIQAVLEALLPDLEATCARHLDDSLEDMGAFAPAAEVMGMRHERAGRRLFMS